MCLSGEDLGKKQEKRLMIPNDLGAESVEILAWLISLCVADDRLCG